MTEAAPKPYVERAPRPAETNEESVPGFEIGNDGVPGASPEGVSQEKLKEAREKARTASNPGGGTAHPKPANSNAPEAANDNHAHHGHGPTIGGILGAIMFWVWNVPKAAIIGIAKRMGESKGGGGGHAKPAKGGGGGDHGHH